MSQAIINLLIHEIQTAHGMELNHVAKGHVDRLMMMAIQKENAALEKSKSEWMNKYLKLAHPPVTYK